MANDNPVCSNAGLLKLNQLMLESDTYFIIYYMVVKWF